MNGVNRVSGVDRDGGDLQGVPNVYYPVGDTASTPAYEHFTDPAAAHGWQNAYDDTVQLDEVVLDGPGPAGKGVPAGEGGASYVYTSTSGDLGVEGGPDTVGRRPRLAEGRRVARGRRRARRRGVLVAGGIGAAVLVGVAVAGLAGLGSSDQVDPSAPTPRNSATAGDRSGAPDTASPSTATADAASPTTSPDAPSASSTASAAAPSASSTASAAAPSAPTSTASTEAPSATSSPSPSSTAATGLTRGNSGGNQGQGQGATKAPK